MSAAIVFRNLESAAREYVAGLEERVPIMYGTGLPTVDEMLAGGIAPGEVAIVAARPSHGKSMFGLQWCLHQAGQGCPCLIISEEMTLALLAERALHFLSAIPDPEWRDRRLDLHDETAAFFKDRRPIIVAENCRTADRACQAIQEGRQHHGIRFAVVDYAQLLRGTGQSRFEQVADVSMSLKSTAVETSVALVVIAQLNRQSEMEKEFLPKLHHLGESGQLERDADVVLFLVWPWKLDRTKHPSIFRVYGAKNRNRGIRGSGAVELVFDPARQMVTEPEAAPITKRQNYIREFDEYNTTPDYQEFPR
jgi:replicative DNA helicase